VLVKPDNVERCLVIHGPHGPLGTLPGAVVIQLDGSPYSWTSGPAASIFATGQDDEAAYRDWFAGLDDVKELDTDATYVLLTPSGTGTAVFSVERTAPSTEGRKCYDVWWRSGTHAERPDHYPPIGRREYEYTPRADVEQICLNSHTGRRITSRHGTLYIPRGSKVFRLDMPSDDDSRDACCSPVSSSPRTLQLGSHIDLQLGIMKQSTELKLAANSTEATINERRMPLKAAMLSLVRDHGLREKTAKDALLRVQRDRMLRFRIKYAAPYELQRSAPSAPMIADDPDTVDNFFGSGLPTQEARVDEYELDLRKAEPGQYNASNPPEPQTMRAVQQAANSGQREVLDTSLLSQLLKGTQDDMLIDRYLGDLMKGLDRKGRLLFNFYWHNEQFADRFGDRDLPALEDVLRNSFTADGELILKLKQKAIAPDTGQPFGATLGDM